MSRHYLDNDRSDSRFPGNHVVDWNSSSSHMRREPMVDPRTATYDRRRDSDSLRYTDRDTGYSARSYQPMTITHGYSRDHRYGSDRDGQARDTSSSRYERPDHAGRNHRDQSQDRSMSRTSIYDMPSASREHSYNPRHRQFSAESTSRGFGRWDGISSFDVPRYSHGSSSHHRQISEQHRSRDETALRTESGRRTSGQRHDITGASWPSFRISGEGRWPFSPDDY